MSKSDVKEAVKRAERQVENTSAGGHLGGTYYGQNPDGKTASTNTNVGKNRPQHRQQLGRHHDQQIWKSPAACGAFCCRLQNPVAKKNRLGLSGKRGA
jgi:hypothetical protein